MKKVFKVCRNIFAVIGVIAVLFVVLCLFAKPYRIGGGNTITTDADQFWAAPKSQ